jgi:flagellar biosynthesis protein FlhG
MKMGFKNGSKAEIWAVGGGKGGTGKTFLVSQLAAYLAFKGKRVILVDADFVGANVHSFFGIKKIPKTINDFFETNEPLERLVMDVGIKNLGIIPGDYRSINPGTMSHSQKLKLFRRIEKLKADYILLDLGGGSSNDTIDSFLLADRMIVVTVPEISAIENLFQFAKKTIFRKLISIQGDNGLKETIGEVWANRKAHRIRNIVELIQHLKKSSDRIDSILTEELADFSLYIALNKVRNSMEIQEGFSIRSICIKSIGFETLYAGYIEYDPQLWKNLSLIQTTPRLNVPHSIKKDILKIAENIITGDQMKISSLRNV